MPFPKTKVEMAEQGYKPTPGPATCRGCQKPIEFWLTPQGKNIPMDPMPAEDSPATSHFATCPVAHKFRGK